MSKLLLIIFITSILYGCAEPELEESTTISVDVKEEIVRKSTETKPLEVEKYEEKIKPLSPWEKYDDINEFMPLAMSGELVFTSADAEELENQVEAIFQEELDEDIHLTTSRWSGFVFVFYTQLKDKFSEEYINKLKELNNAIVAVNDDPSGDDVIRIIQEARKIREKEE